MRRVILAATLALTITACGQLSSQSTPTLTAQSVGQQHGWATLGDSHAYTGDGRRWWAEGRRWWAEGRRWWAEGRRWWAEGRRWWAEGQYQPLPENSAAFTLITLDKAHDLTPRMGEGITVAIIDTGADATHPMLEGALLPGFDYTTSSAGAQEVGTDQDAAYGHGTAVAGLIRQVAPAAKILPLRVLNADGSGNGRDVARAIRDAVRQGARVINLSVSAHAPSDGVRAAITEATRQGAIVIAAAGNNGGARPQAPAWQMSNPDPAGAMSLSVGALDADGILASWSNQGSEVQAPGISITSAYPGGQLVQATGTSFSTPLVSGVVALALAEGADAATLTEALVHASQGGRVDAAQFIGQVSRVK